MTENRGTGKTTRIIEEAIQRLGELPEDTTIFITGAHSRALRMLELDFKASGLVGVKFVLPHQIMNGCLRGVKGILLIDDMYDLPTKEFDYLIRERNILNKKYLIKN